MVTRKNPRGQVGIVDAGPAGMAAALSIGQAGREVTPGEIMTQVGANEIVEAEFRSKVPDVHRSVSDTAGPRDGA